MHVLLAMQHFERLACVYSCFVQLSQTRYSCFRLVCQSCIELNCYVAHHSVEMNEAALPVYHVTCIHASKPSEERKKKLTLKDKEVC